MSNPEVLGILLTGKCNLVCRHCCNESHPLNNFVARIDDIRRLIDEAAEVGSIREVGFSGGEPFLFEALLLDAVAYAKARGYRSSITTNGYWGRSARGRRLVAALKDRGLTMLAISTSTFHREFVSVETVIAAAEAGLDAGLQVTINIVESAELKPVAVLAELGGLADRVGYAVMPLLPVGRGAAQIAADQLEPRFATPLGNCADYFQTLAVEVGGDVYPCCSAGGFTPPLRLGNVKDASIAAIVGNARRNRLISILHSVGPAFFLPFIRAAEADEDLPDRFIDQCHLCHAMLSSPRAAAVVEAAAAQLVGELAMAGDDAIAVDDPLAAVLAARNAGAAAPSAVEV